MNNRNPTNYAASIRAKLLNKARQSNRPFNEILQYFAMERFLYRLSVSPYVSKFVLKGALLFTAWRIESHRSTMDIDMLAQTSNDVNHITEINPISLTIFDELKNDALKDKLWNQFIRKNQLAPFAPNFENLMNDISQFFTPMLN
jgi:hypothetical protein